MPPIIAGIPRLAPYIACAILGSLSLWIYAFMSSTSPGDIWRGPPIPGRAMALSDRSLAFDATGVIEGSPLPASETPSAPVKTVTPPAQKKQTEESSSGSAGGFVVYAGTFFDLGVNVAMERLRKIGLEPWEELAQEMVSVNDVQAGPYASREEAKEAEAQLRAAGVTAKAVETWEGFVISLSQIISLGDAVQEMEKARALGLSTVRLMKIESERSVRKIYVGPFSTKTKAKEISARVAKLGLAVPVIKDWVMPTKNAR